MGSFCVMDLFVHALLFLSLVQAFVCTLTAGFHFNRFILSPYRFLTSRHRFVLSLYRSLSDWHRFVLSLYRSLSDRHRFVLSLCRSLSDWYKFKLFIYKFVIFALFKVLNSLLH